MAEFDDGSECAICMEPLDARDVVALPCACAVAYCFRCWDRALASSFNARGQASCPTCRVAVDVDFDADARNGEGALVFSVAAGGGAAAGAEDPDAALHRVEAVVNRLAGQAAPLMTRRLRRYGEDHGELRPAAADVGAYLKGLGVKRLKALAAASGLDPGAYLEKAELVAAVRAAHGTDGAAAAFAVAAAGDAGPRCVCGGALLRMDGLARYLRVCATEFPDVGDRGDLETVARTLLRADVARGTSSVICDLCDRPVPPRGAVYTCASGETTVLHATEYDVCERCFVDFAVDGRSDGALPQTRRVGAR